MLERDLFTLLDSASDAAYCVTTDGEIVWWNPAAEALLGFPRDEAIGRRIDELLDARDSLGTPALAGGAHAVTRRLDDGRPGQFDLEVRTRSGDTVWVRVSTMVLENPRRRRSILVRLLRDITEDWRRAELLRRLSDVSREVLATVEGEKHARTEALSAQERRILTALATGKRAADIARALHISPKTLRNHLHHINRKLRTHSRLEAVTHAQRRGLIP